jgi:hypothetical protein
MALTKSTDPLVWIDCEVGTSTRRTFFPPYQSRKEIFGAYRGIVVVVLLETTQTLAQCPKSHRTDLTRDELCLTSTSLQIHFYFSLTYGHSPPLATYTSLQISPPEDFKLMFYAR